MAEPTEVPLTQEVQGEHIDEVRSVVDGEKNFFLIFFSAYTDFTDFHRLYRVLPCFWAFKGPRGPSKKLKKIKKICEKQEMASKLNKKFYWYKVNKKQKTREILTEVGRNSIN